MEEALKKYHKNNCSLLFLSEKELQALPIAFIELFCKRDIGDVWDKLPKSLLIILKTKNTKKVCYIITKVGHILMDHRL